MAINITMPEHFLDFYSEDFSDYRHSLTDRGGVYVLYNAVGAVMYVGQTKNFIQRLKAHLIGRDTMAEHYRDINKIRVYFVSNPVERDIYETHIINELRPYVNASKVFFDEAINTAATELDEIEERLYRLQEMREEVGGQLDPLDTEFDRDGCESWDLGIALWEAERYRELDEETARLIKRRRILRCKI